MPLITPTGLIVDFTIVVGPTIPSPFGVIWDEEGADSTGTLVAGGDRTLDLPSGTDIILEEFAWDGDNMPSENRRIRLGRSPSTGGAFDQTEFITLYDTYTCYVWAENTLHEFDVADRAGLGTNGIAWAQTNRPSNVGAGDEIRILFAAGNQTAVVSNFVQGIGTPDAATGLTATPGGGQVMLSWTLNGDGGSPLTGLSVVYQKGSETAQTQTLALTATSATVTGLDNDDEYTFLIRKVNAVGTTDSATINATPTIPDLMPSLPAVADQVATEGAAFTITLPQATGGDTPLTYSLTGAPSWATFTASTRALSGTPDATGTSTLTYTVTDADGDTDSQTFDLRVRLDIQDGLLTTGTNEGARFIITADAGLLGSHTIWYGDDENAGMIEGDADLPPLIDRIRMLSTNNGLAFNRDTGGNFNTYFDDNPGQSLFVALDVGGTLAFYEFTESEINTGAGFFRVERPEMTAAEEAAFDGVANGDRIMFVVADAGSVAVFVDTQPSLPAVDDQDATDGVAFTVTLPEATSGNAPLTYSVTGEPSWATFTAATRILAGTPDAAGTTTVTYTVTDANNDTDSVTFDIEVAAADLMPNFGSATVDNQDATVGTAFTVALPVATGGDGTLVYSVSGEPSWASFNATTLVLSGTPDATGTSTVTYAVTDADGDTDTLTFDIVVAAAPDLIPDFGSATIANQSATVGTPFTLTLPAATGGDGTLVYSVTGEPSWATFTASTRVLAGTPDAAATSTITYTVTDADGDTDTLTFTLAAAVGDTTPAFTSEPVDQSGTVNTAFSYTLPAASGGNAPLTYSVSGEPSWATFNATTRTLSGTPDAVATTTVTYTVEDVDGDTDTATFDIAVSAADLTPTFTATVPNADATVGQAFALTLPVATGGNAPLTYSVTGEPSWLSFDAMTRVLSGTPTTPAAADAITYTVTDTDGDTDTLTFSITVIAAPDLMPSFGGTTVPPQTAHVGEAFSVTLPAASGGDPPLMYSLTGVPGWLSFNPMTRVLSGTPANAGAWSLTYTATDTDGDTATLTFSVSATTVSDYVATNRVPFPFVASPFWFETASGIFPAVAATTNDVLGQIGIFTGSVPNTREARERLRWGDAVTLFAEGGRVLQRGYIISTALTETAGASSLTVTCQSLAVELARRQVPQNRLFIDEPVASLVRWLAGLVDGWGVAEAVEGALSGSVTLALGTQSVYDALVEVSNINGFLFSFRDRTVVIHDRDDDSAPVIARQGMPGAQAQQGTAILTGLTQRQHEHNVANSLRPFSGDAQNQVSLMRATLTDPYQIEKRKVGDRFEYWVTDERCAAIYGLIEASESPDQLIAPLGDIGTAGFNAANTLYQWAATWIAARCEPQIAYDAQLLYLPDNFISGQRVRLIWKGTGVDDVDEVLTATGVARIFGSTGETQAVTLTSNGELEWETSREIARAIRQSGRSVLQLAVASQTVSATVDIGPTAGRDEQPVFAHRVVYDIGEEVVDILRGTLYLSRNHQTGPFGVSVFLDGNEVVGAFLHGNELVAEVDVSDLIPLTHGAHSMTVTAYGGAGELEITLNLALCTGIA